MELKVKKNSITNTSCDVLVVNMFEGIKIPEGATGTLDKALDNLISSYVIEKEKFKGKLNEIYVCQPTEKFLPTKFL